MVGAKFEAQTKACNTTSSPGFFAGIKVNIDIDVNKLCKYLMIILKNPACSEKKAYPYDSCIITIVIRY